MAALEVLVEIPAPPHGLCAGMEITTRAKKNNNGDLKAMPPLQDPDEQIRAESSHE
jgi:hypothetical protein